MGVARGHDGGRVVIRLDESPSTNDEVRQRWAADASGRAMPHLATVVTESQTAGRGRLGRAWVSPPGACLAMSTLLRLDAQATTWVGWLPLAAGLALRDALVRELSGGADAAARVRVKWPNDVLLDGRKVAGILGEVLGVGDREFACVIGTGVNLRLTRDELPVPTATSLALAGVDPVDGGRVERRYLAALTRRLDALVAASGDAERAGIAAELTAACDTLGRRVRVALPGGGMLEGDAVRVDRDGQLVVRTADGTERSVAAGDVERVRPSPAR